MADTLSFRRCSATILALGVLVAIAIITLLGPSSRRANATSDLRGRQGLSLQPAHVVVNHVLSKRPGHVARSAGSLAGEILARRSTENGQLRDYSSRNVAPPNAIVVTGYDATAPPRMLLS